MTITEPTPTAAHTPRPPFERADGPDKVSGSGRYTADLTLTGMLAAKFRYAEVSHARITRLDTTAARAIPGVFAVLTATPQTPQGASRALVSGPAHSCGRHRGADTELGH